MTTTNDTATNAALRAELFDITRTAFADYAEEGLVLCVNFQAHLIDCPCPDALTISANTAWSPDNTWGRPVWRRDGEGSELLTREVTQRLDEILNELDQHKEFHHDGPIYGTEARYFDWMHDKANTFDGLEVLEITVFKPSDAALQRYLENREEYRQHRNRELVSPRFAAAPF